MSSNTPKREWRFYVDDMILFAEKVQRYTQNIDQVAFINSEPYYDATLRNLELIGEAATNIPKTLKQTILKSLGDKSLPPVTKLFMAILVLIMILSGAL
ncbi:MAG: DUF86 domain-containing protein [Crocosphaera sp.]|nr:DUF86 domain-containing protein [Crocosphaera sp.]